MTNETKHGQKFESCGDPHEDEITKKFLERKLEVMAKTMKGKSPKEISGEMGISVSSVRDAQREYMKKLSGEIPEY